MHWSSKYLGRQYDAAAFNCMDLVREVTKEIKGKDVPRFTRHYVMDSHDVVTEADAQFLFQEWASPVNDPEEGDVVLMRIRGKARNIGYHAGIFVPGPQIAHVLHCLKEYNTCMSNIAKLDPFNLCLVGYYRWL